MKTFNKAFYFPLLFLLLFSTHVYAAVTFTQGSSAQDLADQIQGVGITITNPRIINGDSTQVGIYSNGSDEGLEVDEGIILTTLSVTESFTTNSSGSSSVNHNNRYNDTDLLAIDGRASFNPIIFEFDVTLDDNTRLLLIDYQFASEEYNEYVGSQYNDAFGFFIYGGDLNQTYNIARVVDNQTHVTINDIHNYPPVTVNNVNNGTLGAFDDGTPEDLTNSAFFIDNTTGTIDVEYDGITRTLNATLDNLTPGETYHFKMAIADTADANLNTGVFINKINGLREPAICYDYSMKQNEQFIPTDYNLSAGPLISGSVIANDTAYPLEVALYIKNMQESEIVASNVIVDFFGFDTAQATYARDSAWKIETGDIYRTKVDDVDLNVSDSYVKGIPITSFDAYEYFYTYFSIDPLMQDLNMPLNARISYDLTIPLSATQNFVVNRSSSIDTDIPICSDSSNYSPTPGLFSTVHSDYYNLDIGGTNQFYNIPTQVTSREGNFKIISLDINNTDQLQGRSTMVAVELVDISAFHETDASCGEQSSAISERVWVLFENNATSTMFNQAAIQTSIARNMTQINNSANFYAQARPNAAFRISYNVPNDDDDLLIVKPGKSVGTYDINFPDLTTLYGTECAGGRYVVYDKDKNKTTNQVPVACKSNSDITPENLQSCMECIYGYDTKFVCSRDNFAIRPEAFLIHIDDQNQTNPAIQSRLTTNYSGVAAATAAANLQVLNIAAGYNYNIEVNATNHLTNSPSKGYIKSFDPVLNTVDTSQYIWEPRGLTPAELINRNNDCNDTVDKSTNITFMNGVVDTNTSLDQVGEYRLSILDTTWTAVDNNPLFMLHHTGSFFLSSNTPDCTLNSSATYPVDTTIDFTTPTTLSNTLTGCNISSSHTNAHANKLFNPVTNTTIVLAPTDLKYNDYDVTFHPYQFNVATNVTLGEDYVTPPLLDAFIYMADISKDENMSVQINTIITATGKNSTTGLSNFVTGCYAKPLDINISKSNTINTNLEYQYIFNDYNSSGKKELSTAEINAFIPKGINRDVNLSTTDGYFQKDMRGTLDTTTKLNFNREVNTTANPEKITFLKYTVQDPNNRLSADLNINHIAEGYSDINKSTTQNLDITHFYGRTAAKKTTIVCDTSIATCSSGNPDVFIYYEVFCNDVTAGNPCDYSLVPTDIAGNVQQKIDKRWFINFDHNITTYGDLNASEDILNNTYIDLPFGITHANNYTIDAQHDYDIINGLPYTADMNDTVPRWLVHDEHNASAVSNTHQVIFRGQTEWSGAHEADSKTQTDRIQRVNRRTMW